MVIHAHALRVLTVTNHIVLSKREICSHLPHMIGHWTDAIPLHRHVFYILFHTFSFFEQSGAPTDTEKRVPDPVIEELGALLDLFSLLVAEIRQKLSLHVYFSEACKIGALVEYFELFPREVWLFKDNGAKKMARKI